MSEQFDIFFSGQIMDDQDAATVKAQVGKIFKLEGNKLEKLFSGKVTCIKAGVDAATASKYRKVFRDAGALVEIKSATAKAERAQPATTSPPATADDARQAVQEPPADTTDPTPPTTEQDESGMSLLPANTGSLIDCAQEVEPQPIPTTVELELTSAGATIDESEPPPAVEIDTDELSLNPPNSGSLEKFQRKLDPMPIPDISGLSLDEIEESKEENRGEEF